MNYFNQHSYKNVPYNSPGGSGATIATSGCGVCCMATVLSAFQIDVSVASLGIQSIEWNARPSGGTNMSILGAKVSEKYNLQYSTLSDEGALAAHIAKGGVAIANVGGDRAGYKGVFSDGGHYVVVLGVAPDGRLKVYDVGEYSTKYSGERSWRMGVLQREGNLLLCQPAVLDADTKNRTPNYYLFSKKTEKTPLDLALDVLVKSGVVSDATYWNDQAKVVKNLEFLMIKMADKLKA